MNLLLCKLALCALAGCDTGQRYVPGENFSRAGSCGTVNCVEAVKPWGEGMIVVSQNATIVARMISLISYVIALLNALDIINSEQANTAKVLLDSNTASAVLVLVDAGLPTVLPAGDSVDHQRAGIAYGCENNRS